MSLTKERGKDLVLAKSDEPEIVLLYYKYQKIDNVEEIIKSQEDLCKSLNLEGRIRIASEGINGTLSGAAEAINKYIDQTSVIFPNVDWKTSKSSKTKAEKGDSAFNGLIVKEFSSIVGSNSEVEYDIAQTGVHLSPQQFHEKAQEEGSVLIDVRNSYEFAIGHFDNALNPNTRSFNRFDEWIDKAKELDLFKNKSNILMYCTGGIRCEKASIQLKRKLGLTDGDEEDREKEKQVFQLKGGIHRYLEAFGDSKEESLFKGKNFVFDKRVCQKADGVGVVGRCNVCENAFDEIIDQRRCNKCRLLILICDECEKELNGQYWCDQHQYLNPRVYEDDDKKKHELLGMINEMKRKLSSDHFKGRKKRGKRLLLRKQIEELESLEKLVC